MTIYKNKFDRENNLPYCHVDTISSLEPLQVNKNHRALETNDLQT